MAQLSYSDSAIQATVMRKKARSNFSSFYTTKNLNERQASINQKPQFPLHLNTLGPTKVYKKNCSGCRMQK